MGEVVCVPLDDFFDYVLDFLRLLLQHLHELKYMGCSLAENSVGLDKESNP